VKTTQTIIQHARNDRVLSLACKSAFECSLFEP